MNALAIFLFGFVIYGIYEHYNQGSSIMNQICNNEPSDEYVCNHKI